MLAARTFTDCEAAKKALDIYKLESDSVAQFLEEEGYNKSSYKYPIPVLYGFYKDYCENSGFRRLSKPNFIKRLRALDIEVVRINTGNVAYLYPGKIESEIL